MFERYGPLTMGKAVEVVMPQLGESIVEGTVVRWAVEVGQSVRRGDLLAEVETDKATADIPASIDGTVEALVVEEGAVVPVGRPVALLRPETSAADADRAPSDPTVAPRPSEAPAPISPAGAPAGPMGTATATAAATAARGRLPNRRLIDQPAPEPGGPRRTSPAVRRLARFHGIDIHGLLGTGHHGRVTRDDVLAAVDAGERAGAPAATQVTQVMASPAPAAAVRPPKRPLGPEDRIEPLGRRRRLIAQNLKHSLDTAAHVATVAEIDMHAVFAARKLDGPHAARQGIKLTVLTYVVQAVAQTLSEVPQLNATIEDDQVIWRGARNIGIAVDTPSGIIVPVVRRADELGLMGLARVIESLSGRARDGTITADDLAAGTFTISNPGREGNLFGISIIRQPEVGILRIGSAVKRPVVREIDGEDHIVVRPIMYAALSYDHRLIDGRTGNGFLFRLARRLEAVRPTFGAEP